MESDDEDITARNKSIAEASPYGIIGSTETVTTVDGRKVRGREYIWGVAEVENDGHCDFNKLRNLLIRTHMIDLITSTEENHYEQYRQQQMATRKFGEPKQVPCNSISGLCILIKCYRAKKVEHPKFREKEESLRKLFTDQVKSEETRFRQWEQQVKAYVEREVFLLNFFIFLAY